MRMVKIMNEKIEYNLKTILEVFLSLFFSAIVLMMASKIFKGFYVESFGVAFVTSIVITVLNQLVKPILIYFTLPVTLLTLGLFYPFINVIILKLAGLIMGESFVVTGIFIPIIISLFISFMNLVFKKLLVKPIVRR